MKIAHISDTHLGYEAYRTVSAGGENQRSVDVARAFTSCVKDIREWDPPLVVHSGDLAEKPHISIRLMLLARRQIADLAEVRKDGSRRQVVIIAGNHDLPANRREACWIELLRDVPGVHVVCDKYTVVRFADIEGASEELRDVEVHCLPHDVLKDMAVDQRFDEVQPTPGKTNILTAHGVAGGSGLYKRVMGREFTVPTDVLVREWAYGALGHWHRQGPVNVAGAQGRCWYAGSSENMGFGDLLDNGEERGYLRIEVSPGEAPKITPRNLPIRSMFRLPVVDGSGKTPQEIETALMSGIEKARAEGRLGGAIVGQNVTGVTREVWALVDWQKARGVAMASAMQYEISVMPVNRVSEEDENGTEKVQTRQNRSLADVMTVVRERAEKVLQKSEREGAVKVCESVLEKHLAHVASSDESTDVTPEDAGKTVEAEHAEVAK